MTTTLSAEKPNTSCQQRRLKPIIDVVNNGWVGEKRRAEGGDAKEGGDEKGRRKRKGDVAGRRLSMVWMFSGEQHAPARFV